MQILTSENTTLRKKSKRVSAIDDSVRNLAHSMVKTMYDSDGVGLSAVQIGVLKQIIVVDNSGTPIIMVNPLITKFSDETVEMEEGCLSCPGVFKVISRPKSLDIKYRDLKGKPHFETYDGLIARIIQHEILHLYGELIV